MSSFHNNALVGASGQGGYQIERSLRFNSADSAYLSKIVGAGGGTTKNAVSLWVKRSALGTQQALFQARQDASNQQYIGFTTSNAIELGIFASGSYVLQKITSAVYRDASAWYHVFFYQDNTLATAEDRYQLYINGVRVTAWSTNTNTATQSNAYYFGSNVQHYIAAYGGASTLDGYLTEFHFIYQPTTTPLVGDFGETDTITGVWKPKRYAGTYGTNGFYLKFADNSGTTSTTLGKDSSGNSNNWTPNNFSVTAGAGNDSLIDTPTPYADGGNGRGNYCTLNPLDGNQYSASAKFTCSNGNLTATGGSVTANGTGTIALPAGKWYVEFTVGSIATPSTNYMWFGCQDVLGFTGNGSGYNNSGAITCNGSVQGTFATFTAGDVIGCAYNITDNQVAFYKNGVQQGTTGTLGVTTKQYNVWMQINSNGDYFNANFGQRAFAYTPPSGFLALNTQNLPEPSIKKPSSYMDVKLYTGNGGTQTISGLGFSPDLVWIKGRSNVRGHRLLDTVRGATNFLASNLTNAESAETSGLTSFTSDGFSLGSDLSYNGSGETLVAWCWDESATPGFDIVTYTGTGSATTVAHNLGVAPSMMVIKRRDAAEDWGVYHVSMGNGNYMYLDGTQGATAGSIWNNTSPTSSVFSVGTSVVVNANTGTYVAYLWSEVAGFSKFGSYTGNGSSDGPFVFCGFRPKFVMIKGSSFVSDWPMQDAARSSYNTTKDRIWANLSSAETVSTYDIDFLSNGFKVRTVNPDTNTNGGTIIFAAFAESPFKYSLAR